MSGRVPVSVCVVAMNEEDNIAACLASVDFADEVVVVDSHSTDRTREIAAALGARVIQRDWPGHIEQKNFAIEQAEHEWVLCLDADERLSQGARSSVLAALADTGARSGYSLNRRTWYLGRWIRHGGWYPDTKVRLFKRTAGKWGGDNPHDHVYVEGEVAHLDGDLLHYSYRSIADHLRIIDSYTTIMARGKAAKGERPGAVKLLLRPAWKFLRMYVLKAGFLDGMAGLIVALLGSYYVFLKYAKLFEITHRWHERPEEGA